VSPWAAEARLKGAVDKVTAGVLAPMHRECSTWTEASGWAVARRWAYHAGHVEETEQKLASLTVGCGMRSVGIRPDSSLRPP
jgi:hypothetical protein